MPIIKIIKQPAPRTVGVYVSRGEQGPVGAAGKSAYEIALDNGFVGTEAEWLASLEANSDAEITAHINNPTPHPAYDDISSLTLLFENGLV